MTGTRPSHSRTLQFAISCDIRVLAVVRQLPLKCDNVVNRAMRLTDEYVPRILIADDQPDVLEALRFLIKGEGYQAEAVNSPAGILESVESRDFDAVVMLSLIHI